MNFIESIEKLSVLINDPKTLTIASLEELMSGVSIADNISPTEAVTHLYTKVYNYDFMSDSVRLIDHTDIAKVLTYIPQGQDVSLYDTALEIVERGDQR